MKVGLFGDSYACLTLGNNSAWFEKDIILEKYQLVSYAKKGSDITWSYKLFLEHHEKFEKNIFIVTESTRHSFKVGNHTLHVSNIDVIDHLKDQIKDFKIQAILNSLKQHYVYSMSIDLYDFGLAGMVEHVKQLRPDTIIVFGFNNHSIKKITGTNFYLSQVSMMELENFEINFDWMKKEAIGEGRSAHLTDENNIIFAEYIRKVLDGLAVSIDIEDFRVPDKKEAGRYFVL